MQEDENVTLTWASVELTVSGWIYVKDPAGSYPIDPDAPLYLGDVLKAALDECGLGDRLEDVYRACRSAAAPHFEKPIAELEAVRRRVLADAEASSLSQPDPLDRILDSTGSLSSGPPNLTPVRGTEGEQHVPYEAPKKTGPEKKR